MTKLKIAIIGAGTGGMCAAFSLMKKFNNKVEVTLFEKDQYFDLDRGVELTIGPLFQLAMLEMGMDVNKLKTLSYLQSGQCVRDSSFAVMQNIESAIQDYHNEFSVVLPSDNKRYQLYGYCIKHGIFMDFLRKELLRINDNKEVIQYGCDLQQIISTLNGKKKLLFSNHVPEYEFDFIIGADGVHSQVRNLLFDQISPHHVGVNILYGVIPRNLEEFVANSFYIVVGDQLTTVFGRYFEKDQSISTWWGIIYNDKINKDAFTTAFWEKRNASAFIKDLAHQLVKSENNPFLQSIIAQTPDANFKYSGRFLERDPASLQDWGKDNVVLLGDAVHCMMPWAAVGAGMAAEDVFTLMSLFEKYKVFESEDTFKKIRADNVFENLYDEYKKARIARLHYFFAMTHQTAPKGVMSREDFRLNNTDIEKEYGNQRALSSSPLFGKLLNDNVFSEVVRSTFFGVTLDNNRKLRDDESVYDSPLGTSNKATF